MDLDDMMSDLPDGLDFERQVVEPTLLMLANTAQAMKLDDLACVLGTLAVIIGAKQIERFHDQMHVTTKEICRQQAERN